MAKILIAKGDEALAGYDLSEDNFVFIFTKQGVYHVDISNGKMHLARPDLSNLGEGHKKIISSQLKSEKVLI